MSISHLYELQISGERCFFQVVCNDQEEQSTIDIPMDIRGYYARSKSQYDWFCEKVESLGLQQQVDCTWYCKWRSDKKAVVLLEKHLISMGAHQRFDISSL